MNSRAENTDRQRGRKKGEKEEEKEKRRRGTGEEERIQQCKETIYFSHTRK